MATREFSKGTLIATEGQHLDTIFIIAQGSVKATFPGGHFVLKKGDIIGLCDIAYDSHFFTYEALESTTALVLPLSTKNSIKDLLKTNAEISKMVYTSALNQVLLFFTHYTQIRTFCKDLYKEIFTFYDTYIDACSKNNIISRSLPQFDQFNEYVPEEEIEDWVISYYASFRGFPAELKQQLPAQSSFLTGFVHKASLDIHSAFSICEAMDDYISESMSILVQDNHIDMFDLFTSVLFRLSPGSEAATGLSTSIEQMIDLVRNDSHVDPLIIQERVSDYRTRLQGFTTETGTQSRQDSASRPDGFPREITNSLDMILDYSGVEDDVAAIFKDLINKYKKLSDKTSTADSAIKLRQEITKYFNILYATTFRNSVKDYSVPTVIKMFLNFGYVDEELAGVDNAYYLYTLADYYTGDDTYGVYTLYEWLKAIYNKRKDPSRNELDVDFLSYIHELRVSGKISAETENKLAASPEERVNYELENMFPTVNKVTYGRISTYCPVFSEHNVIKPLPSCLVSVDNVIESLKKITSVDYGAFNRETVYTNEKAGITKEYISVKIMPDIILFPNIGTRGVMWQEIEGRKRTTPARFMISAFHLEDIPTTFVRMVGEFRWELCKRIQGNRWNDVTDRSLTSEYFDYIQFYRKNSELSADAKEKIKTGLVKAKNSFKEMFIRDYYIWVTFEGAGSPRLNKLVRTMMCTYCPFPYELRQQLISNPLFKETLEHYEVKVAQKKHHYDNVILRLKNSNTPIPNELLSHMKFIEGK